MSGADRATPKSQVQGRICVMLLLCLSALGGAARAQAQGDCKAVYDADDKMLATNHHAFATHASAGGKSETTEAAMIGGVSYVQIKGVWRKSPLTLEQLREQKAENRKNAKVVSCRYLRDEVVEGETARVFSAHSETEDEKSDVTVWISRNRGLPLRQEQDVDLGDAGGKTHYSVRYDYNNVSAPAVH